MKKTTKAIHTPYPQPDAYGALAEPIYTNVAYEFGDAQQMADAFTGRLHVPNYARVENPTVTNFEHRVRNITGAEHVTAYNSGMAAIANALLAVSAQGRNIITSKHLFGNTLALITTTLFRFGVKPKLRDLTDLQAVEDSIDENTCCIFLEIVTNPQMEVADLKALSEIAHRKGVPLIADTTVIPFTETDMRSLGVDVEVVSSTKYISGGGNLLGGLVIDYGMPEQFNKRLKVELLYNLGAYMSPQTAHSHTLGLETLDVRYQRQAANAQWLAEMLREVKGIASVNYIGLADNPFHDLAKRQFGETAGAMLTIDLDSRESAWRFLNRLRVIHRATNLFDSRSLAIHPASTIFGMFPERQLEQMDVRQTTVRLSIGLEDKHDLLEDIVQAVGSRD